MRLVGDLPSPAPVEGVLSAARSDENHLVTILALDGLGRLSADADENERATELLGEADALHPAVAHLLDDTDRYDRAAALTASSALSG